MTTISEDNPARIQLLRELLVNRAHPDEMGLHRDNWDSVSFFDSDRVNEIDEFILIVSDAIQAKPDSTNLRELSSLMRETSGKIKFKNSDQIQKWLATCRSLVDQCQTDHNWRRENGAEWYHDAINSICGNAVHASISVILLNPNHSTQAEKDSFQTFITCIISTRIENSPNSHAEPVVATLSRNALWLTRSFPSWLETIVFNSLQDFQIETSRAFWQGFLVNRIWDLEFLKASALDGRILKLLKHVKENSLTYEDYLGRDSSESFVFLLVELFLRTPSDQQLADFFNAFVMSQLNSRLFIRWLDAMSWSLQKIDSLTYPNLSDEIFTQRLKPLLELVIQLELSPETVGIIAESLGSLRSTFPEALQAWEELKTKFHSQFSRNSRILMWLKNGSNGKFLVDNFPNELLKFISSYLIEKTRDQSMSDWELSEFVSIFGLQISTEAPKEFQDFLTVCKLQNYSKTIEIWTTVSTGS